MSDLLSFLTTHEERFRKGRLGALYSDFRHLRTTNPDGYSANISAWQKALTDAARAGQIPSRGNDPDILILSVSDELLRALETKEWGRPLSLGAVINDMLYKKDLIPVPEFLDAKRSIYQRPRVASQLFYWSLRQLGFSHAASDTDEEDKLPTGRFVVISNVEAAMKQVSTILSTKTTRVEKIYSKELFCAEITELLHSTSLSASLSPTDLDILLKYLARDKQMIAYDKQTVKILTPGSKESPSVTNEDTALASLKSLITTLQTQNTSLTTKISSLSTKARDAVTAKNIISARSILRSKKLAEKTLERRMATLAQLEEVYASIEQAADQVEFVHVMEVSTGVLRGLSEEVGGVERVDRVVERLRSEIERVDEVGEAVAEVGRERERVDEGEVGDELEVLEREEREKVERREREEREERDRREKVEREDGEEREVEETRRKLDDLPKVGEDQKEKETERPILETSQGLKRMSLEPAEEQS